MKIFEEFSTTYIFNENAYLLPVWRKLKAPIQSGLQPDGEKNICFDNEQTYLVHGY